MKRETAAQYISQYTEAEIAILVERLPELIELCWKAGVFSHQGSVQRDQEADGGLRKEHQKEKRHLSQRQIP